MAAGLGLQNTAQILVQYAETRSLVEISAGADFVVGLLHSWCSLRRPGISGKGPFFFQPNQSTRRISRYVFQRFCCRNLADSPAKAMFNQGHTPQTSCRTAANEQVGQHTTTARSGCRNTGPAHPIAHPSSRSSQDIAAVGQDTFNSKRLTV